MMYLILGNGNVTTNCASKGSDDCGRGGCVNLPPPCTNIPKCVTKNWDDVPNGIDSKF